MFGIFQISRNSLFKIWISSDHTIISSTLSIDKRYIDGSGGYITVKEIFRVQTYCKPCHQKNKSLLSKDGLYLALSTSSKQIIWLIYFIHDFIWRWINCLKIQATGWGVVWNWSCLEDASWVPPVYRLLVEYRY